MRDTSVSARDERSTPEIIPFPKAEYLAAIEDERGSRDFVFLGLPLQICGVDVVAMTLRQFLTRINIGCPFFCGGTPDEADIASFIWFLSPDFSLTRALARARARDRIIQQLAPVPYDEAVKGIEDYLDLIFLDSPPSIDRKSAPRCSIAAVLIDIFGAAYSWTDDRTLDSPLPVLYQLVREIQHRANPRTVFFNRKSDKVRGDWLRERNQRSEAGDQSVGRDSVEPKHSENVQHSTLNVQHPIEETEQIGGA